jgi:hypothetical protein
VRRILLAASLVAASACGGAAREAPVAATYVVDVPPPRDEELPTEADRAAARAAACPADTVAENGVCVRVLASPEIPAWEAPRGHGDPCATWTSETGLFDCDVKNENAPDAGL